MTKANIISLERAHLFSPNINVAAKIDIFGKPSIDALKAAIVAAIKANEILQCRIALLENGDGLFEKVNKPLHSIEVSNKSWIELIRENQPKIFKLGIGEFIRFFIIKNNDELQLLIIAHHIAGDGLSLVFLIEDIMKALSGEELEYKKLNVMGVEDLPADSSINPIARVLLKRMNREWLRSEKIFSFQEYEKMFNRYWKKRKSHIFFEVLKSTEYEGLYNFSKKNNVSINSIITTVLIKAFKGRADLGIALNIRRDRYRGMGNYTSGISVQYSYNDKLSFIQNAKIVHRLIYRKLKNPKRKYLVPQFMGLMSQTYIDSACMYSLGEYDSRAAKKLAHLMGYDKPKDISLTNLTKLNIPNKYGDYEIKNYCFVAPLIPSACRVVGVACLDQSLSLTMHVLEDNGLEDDRKLFLEVINSLRRLSDNS